MEDQDYREVQRSLQRLSEEVNGLYKTIDIENLQKRLADLERETQMDGFWKDKERFAEVNQELSRVRRKVDPWRSIVNGLSETKELMEMAIAENDGSLLQEITETVEKLADQFESLQTRELLSEEDDANNAFISIHPGAGGTESQDWASMLYRMYFRWAEKKGYDIDVFDYTPGEEAGIKSSTLLIKGEYAYGFLKSEMGVHRLVRISPYDANKRRHTSFASVEVMPELSEDIEVNINEDDLKIDTYRSSGPAAST